MDERLPAGRLAPRWTQQVATGWHSLLESGILLTAVAAAALNMFFNGAKGDAKGSVKAAKPPRPTGFLIQVNRAACPCTQHRPQPEVTEDEPGTVGRRPSAGSACPAHKT